MKNPVYNALCRLVSWELHFAYLKLKSNWSERVRVATNQSTNWCQLGSMVCRQTGLVDGLTQRNCFTGIRFVSHADQKKCHDCKKNARSDWTNTQQLRQSPSWFHCPCVSVRTGLILGSMTNYFGSFEQFWSNRDWNGQMQTIELRSLKKGLENQWRPVVE